MNDTEPKFYCSNCGVLSRKDLYWPHHGSIDNSWDRGEATCKRCHNTVTPKPSAKVMQGPLEVEEKNGPIELPDGLTCKDMKGAFAARGEQFVEKEPRSIAQWVIRPRETEWKPSLDAEIRNELSRAKSKFPEWPTDPIHAFAIVAEEFGEAAKEVLQLTYEPTKSTVERIRTETIQLAAMCHRFLESLDRYEFKPSAQHEQK